ncbi:glycosyl hydrolase family 88 [Arcticibacter pallidicorallinus]|uniref:Glycosyl hydrolase family 88 n=1 Tax=Arcticibacter pallidicorallinus TaxID=1259464 RepID=A0A2T0U6Q3_9SPHI|nr:glycoside hydrolase family 88 protein [Arcticibacter pallidicorallinus]PRY53590.1 glycosyl hydrolase family 88 [Arcticibacter pallidicorallinus]
MKYFLSLALISCAIGSVSAQKINVKKQFAFAESQTNLMLEEIKEADARKGQVMPRTLEDGKLKLVVSKDWTSGFFPGELWYLYEYTRDAKWLDLARKFTGKLQKEQFNTGTHDLGFIMFCSYGNGLRLTGDQAYKDIVIQSSKSLSKRFSPSAGVIRSWDHNRDKWLYPVIIDNMMNLEMLFAATKLTGDSSFYKIAVTHADNTLKNHFRPDYSTYHVIDYHEADGTVRKKNTHQGYNDESAWARGQAWALYGYTLCFRETKNAVYLNQAEKVADFILSQLPKDMVPYWDYNDPGIPGVSRDASAAAIAASALFELSLYSKNAKGYKKAARKMLKSLSAKYASEPGTNRGFILDHSTGHKPKNSEVDVPINYADYYYLEALLRYKNMK